jgi:hypothetical protein
VLGYREQRRKNEMTMQLHPCALCRRHVEVTATVCPFCSSALSPVQPSVRFVGGRLSRAAVFAGATLVSANGCWTSSSPSQAPTVPNQASTTAGAGAITGHVYNSQSHEAIASVGVTLISPDRRRIATRTDSDGTFVFSGLAPGDYTLEWIQEPTNRRRDPDEPRTMRQTVMVGAGQTAIADITLYFPVPSNVKMPYGAPPMRGRVV